MGKSSSDDHGKKAAKAGLCACGLCCALCIGIPLLIIIIIIIIIVVAVNSAADEIANSSTWTEEGYKAEGCDYLGKACKYSSDCKGFMYCD